VICGGGLGQEGMLYSSGQVPVALLMTIFIGFLPESRFLQDTVAGRRRIRTEYFMTTASMNPVSQSQRGKKCMMPTAI
jgi:hypothetical protein